MSKPILSYTTLSNLYVSPHSYLNKQLSLKPPETEAMLKGRDLHKIIQDHLLGVKKDDRLSSLDWNFQKAEVHVKKDMGEFLWHGYLDCCSYASKVFCEIKTGKNPWNQSRFSSSPQPAYYAYVSGLHKTLFITCDFELGQLKTFYKEFSEEDLQKAKEWAEGAQRIIIEGRLKEDLTERDGKFYCENPACPYKENCQWRT